MNGKMEHRICIKSYVKLGKCATETLEMLHETFGEYSLSRTAFFEWHSHFKAGRVLVEDDRSSGQPKHQQNDRKC
jgi:hypothetical protein